MKVVSGLALSVALCGSAVAHVAPNPRLGTEGAACRPGESGPAIEVWVDGLKDRKGVLRLELYPDNDEDFLADDAKLVEEGKPFRRVDMPVPPTGRPMLCIRTPSTGTFTLALLHDRNGDQKFNAFADGAGFPGNPHLGLSKPAAAKARIMVEPGMNQTAIRLNYWRGFSFGPLRKTG